MIRRALATVITLVILIAGGYFIARSLRASSSAGGNQYRVAAVKADLVKKTVTATGVLTPWRVVDIKSRAGGRVISLPVDDGITVKRGQLIAKIDPSDTLLTYNSARADIDSNDARVDETRKTLDLQKEQTLNSTATAEASLQSATAAASAAKARYDSAVSTSSVQQALSQAAIDSAKATLAAEEAKLAQMDTALHPQDRASAAAALAQARANMDNSHAQLVREKALVAKGFVAQSQVDQAQATYDVAKAVVAGTQEKVDTVGAELASDRSAEVARVNQEKAALANANANLVQVDLKRQDAAAALAQYKQAVADMRQTEVKLKQSHDDRLNNVIRQTQIAQAKAAGASAKARLSNAKVQLDDTRITAPDDGVILKKYVEQGTFITSGQSFNSSGTSLVQLGDVSRMYVDVQVDETDVANVDNGQAVDITFDAYPTMPFEGKVIKVEPQAVVDQNVTTVHVRVEVDNSDTKYRLLKPGMNATCEFVIKKIEDAVCIPNEALKSDADGSRYVEIANGGKPAPAEKDSDPDLSLFVAVKVVKRPVEIGLEGNDTTEVTSGLKVGDKVITQTVEPTTASPAAPAGFGGGRSAGPGRR